ncbi:MAG: methyltransferase [Euryarchaeota archaeon]|nr:methyltransferase [Euryarchaeota archaeon]
MRKSELERVLQTIPPHQDPRPSLEQYCTPATIAADVLYIALGFGDIEGKNVIDLGCGTGIFSIGSALLGASSVLGIDIDPLAIDDAKKMTSKLGLEAEYEMCDVKDVRGTYDTVIMNPPFGSQRKGADRPFLETAIDIAPVVYSLHNAITAPFLEKIVASLGRSISFQKSYKFQIPHLFKFHERVRKEIDVLLLRIC